MQVPRRENAAVRLYGMLMGSVKGRPLQLGRHLQDSKRQKSCNVRSKEINASTQAEESGTAARPQVMPTKIMTKTFGCHASFELISKASRCRRTRKEDPLG